MITPTDLAQAFERNRTVVRRQAEGLSHADSLLQPPFRANCFNWVTGHIAVHRDRVLTLLGAEPAFAPGRADRYGRESEPILEDGPGVIALADLLDAIDRGQVRLSEALASVTDDDLAAPVAVGDRSMPLGARLHFLYFHDSYHTGQTELLRQLAGIDDKII